MDQIMWICPSILIHRINIWPIGKSSCRLIPYLLLLILIHSISHPTPIICLLHKLRIPHQYRTQEHWSRRRRIPAEKSSFLDRRRMRVPMRILSPFRKIRPTPQKIIITGVIYIKTLLLILIDKFRIRAPGAMEEHHLFYWLAVV